MDKGISNGSTNIFSDYLSIPENPEDLFTLTESLGHGAFGSVYKAIHNKTKMVVAIKIISNTQENSLNSLQKEISLMKICDESVYIVKYYGSYFSKKKNEIWLILEFCESGSTIDLMFAMNRTFSESEIASIIEMTLHGLVALHSKKLIHRDIKGANILLNSEGYAKLGDFGVGVKLEDNLSFRSSKKGSPYWMSPQVVTNSEYDCKTDIWSLGITCIELCEGEPPLSEYKPFNVMNMIAKKPPKGLPEGNTYTKEFNDFVSKCLIIDPLKRPNAKQLLEHQFIKRFSQGREYIKNLISYHISEVEEYRKEMATEEIENESILSKLVMNDIIEKENENASVKEENNDNGIDANNIDDGTCSVVFKENDDKSVITRNTNANKDSTKGKPLFMNYINNNNFIFDEQNLIELAAKQNIENLTTSIKNSTKSKNIISDENEQNIPEPHQKTQTNMTDKTSTYTIRDSLLALNQKYTIIQKFRNNTLAQVEKKSNGNNIGEKNFKIKKNIVSLESLLQDKELNTISARRIAEEIKKLKTEKEYELNYIMAKFDEKIKKYECALQLLDKYPNLKSLKEYEEKYGTEDIENLTTRENNNTSAINKSTNCKSHQKDSLLSSMSNIMEDEDDDEHNTNNNQNLHSAKSSRFNTHFSYFNTNK